MTQQNGIPKLADERILEQDSTPQTNQLVARIQKGEIITHPFIAKDDVELCHAERRRYFILHHFNFHTVTYCFFSIFYLRHTTNIETNRSIEF